jgi:dihydrofolate reductase
MAKLVYTAITSLDGYIEDESGQFGWAMPDAEVHAFVNDLERSVGTYLYGRRMYETMAVWQTIGLEPAGTPPEEVEFAEVWRAADKVVYSRTLDTVSLPKTRLEHEFDADEVRALKTSADRDVSVGGPGLASAALGAGIVDELRLITVPVVVGGGTAWLPDDVRIELELADERRFGNGFVYLDYRARTSG